MIDVHHHVLPEIYTDVLKPIGVEMSGGTKFPAWNSNAQLEMMNWQAISCALLSISSPGIYFGDQTLTNNLARQCKIIWQTSPRNIQNSLAQWQSCLCQAWRRRSKN